MSDVELCFEEYIITISSYVEVCVASLELILTHAFWMADLL